MKTGITNKALNLLNLLAIEAGMGEQPLSADSWQDWGCATPGGEIRGQWRTLRCVAAAAALGDVQCLIRLRTMFALPIFC